MRLSKKFLRESSPCIIILVFMLLFYHRASKESDDLANKLAENYFQENLLEVVNSFNYSRFSAEPCTTNAPYLLIAVHSSPRHFVYRSAIRKTWASLSKIFKKKVRTVFFVGLTSVRIQTKLEDEMKKFQDIVQGNFVDSYRNLTYKHLLMYRWTTGFCGSSKYVMKVDDDVFVDTYRAVTLLHRTFGSNPRNVLACLIIPSGSLAQRSGKWTVSKDEYVLDVYPEYCSGMAYFVTPDVIKKLLLASAHYDFFWIDDVLTTGFLAERANVHRKDMGVWYARNERLVLKWLYRNSSQSCPWMFCELLPENWPFNAVKLWRKSTKIWLSTFRVNVHWPHK